MADGTHIDDRVLAALAEGPGTIGELLIDLGTFHQNVSDDIRRLERKGLVARSPEKVRFPGSNGPTYVYSLKEHATCRAAAA